MQLSAVPLFSISGTVIDGDKIGRTLGFPTANLDVKLAETQLKPGVYLGTCQVATPSHQEESWACLAYFGPRLIFGELTNSFEVYIYNFSHNIYGQTLHVNLTHFLRAPLPFSTLPALQAQLEQDKLAGHKILNNPAKTDPSIHSPQPSI